MVAYLTSGSSQIWSSSEHHLEPNHTHGKVVDCDAVIVSAHDLRCHVARCAGCVLIVLGLDDSCNAKVSHTQIPVRIEHHVLRLDVPMNDALIVDHVKCQQHACDEEL